MSESSTSALLSSRADVSVQIGSRRALPACIRHLQFVLLHVSIPNDLQLLTAAYVSQLL